MAIFLLWAHIPSSAMEITTLVHIGVASAGGFVKGYDTAWGWKDHRVTDSQLRLQDSLYWAVMFILSKQFVFNHHN